MSKPNHLKYRESARTVDRGWLRGFWLQGGQICGWQAVLRAEGISALGAELPMQMQRELDSELIRTGTYCTSTKDSRERRRCLSEGKSLRNLFIKWNDAEGRTKEDVVRLLDSLADRLEASYILHMRRLIANSGRQRIPWDELDSHLDAIWGEHFVADELISA